LAFRPFDLYTLRFGNRQLPIENLTPRPRVLFVNRSYWPDAEATGQLLTDLCQDLAGEFDVEVIAGQPNKNPEQKEYRRRGVQQRNGVRIRRVWHTQFAKASFVGRLLNYVSFLLTATAAALTAPRPDAIVVETDPPLLCLLGALARWRHGLGFGKGVRSLLPERPGGCFAQKAPDPFSKPRLIVYLQDIYPDVAVAIGKLRDGWLTRWLRQLFFRVYRNADQVVVLSDDMCSLLVKSGVSAEVIRVIPNWVDTTRVEPVKVDNRFRDRHGLDDRFVVMYSGNMGLCQQLDNVLLAAGQLQDRSDVIFVLIGDGASKTRLQKWARERQLTNVRFLDYQPRSELSASLSAADIHLVPLDPRVTRCLMPSKLYGILASATPLVAIAPKACELARISEEHEVGFVVEPEDPDALADTLRWCAGHRHQLQEMGTRARRLAEKQYDRRISTGAFASMLQEVMTGQTVPSEPVLQKAA